MPGSQADSAAIGAAIGQCLWQEAQQCLALYAQHPKLPAILLTALTVLSAMALSKTTAPFLPQDQQGLMDAFCTQVRECTAMVLYGNEHRN
jgi:hypothetical protein